MNTEQIEQAYSDRLNPILVKEIRQALKSRFFTISFALMLGMSLAITLVVLLSYDAERALRAEQYGYGREARTVVSLLYSALAIAAFFLVPAFAYHSVNHEMDARTFDLLMITTLSPRRIVLGKLSSSLLQLVIFFSAAIPFMATMYLLGGMDIISLLMLIIASFLIAAGLCAMAICVAMAVRERKGRMVYFIVALLLLMVCAGPAMGAMIAMFHEGEWARAFNSSEFLMGFGVTVSLYACLVGLFLTGAIVSATFRAENRSTPVRLMLLITWAVGTIWSALIWWLGMVHHRNEMAIGYGITATLFIGLSGLILVSEENRLSQRVARSYPRRRVFGLWGLLMYPGGVRGFWFMTALLAATALLAFLGSAHTPGSIGDWMMVLGTACYIVLFTGLPLIVITLFAGNRRGAHRAVGVSALILAAAMCILPMFSMIGRGWHNVGGIAVLSPFVALSDSHRAVAFVPLGLIAASIIAFIGVFLRHALRLDAPGAERQPLMATDNGLMNTDTKES